MNNQMQTTANMANVVLQKRANRVVARTNMAYGAILCIGGILVTVLTYQAASEGGGHYVIAWGAAVLGGFHFLRGLVQLLVNLF